MMSSHTTPKGTVVELINPSPPTEAPHFRPREFTRHANANFGSRLASARNLAPSELPCPPPPRAFAPIVISGKPPFLAGPFTSDNTAAYKASFRYGGIKGSYTSPYDGGRTPGDTRLPTSSTTVEEFESMFGSRVLRSLDNTPSESSEESAQTVTLAPIDDRFDKGTVVHAVPDDVSNSRLSRL
jgi:hypothetical protein